MDALKLYYQYARINTKGILQYKLWYLQIITSAVHTAWDFIAVVVLYLRFGNLGSWEIGHMLLVFGLGAVSFGLAEWFSRGLDIFPWYVNTGAFDRILLRPRSTLLQTMGERFQPERGGRVIVGLGCIIVAANLLQLRAGLLTITMLSSAIAGGWFVYTGVFTFFATIAFWTIGPINIVYMFTNHTLQYLKIPYKFYNIFIRRTLTFAFPIALFTYFPVMSLTDNTVAVWTGFCALPAGALFFALSVLAWRFGVKHYHSTGS